MTKELLAEYQQIQTRILEIFQGDNFIRKAALGLGLITTVGSLILLLVVAWSKVVVFLAGVIILSWAMRKTS